MEISASDKALTPFYALIAAGGSGQRMDSAAPKQYMEINGVSPLRRALDAFLACPGLRGLKIVIDPAHETLYRKATADLKLDSFVPGGRDRKESVRNGLSAFTGLEDDAVILIHDAARPFVTREQIEAVAETAQKNGAATLALPVSDTLKKESGDYVSRDGLHALQTPQGFHYGLIKKAHKQQGSFTDDTSLVAALGYEIKLIPGNRENFKITTMDDLIMAEKLMPRTTRIGMGFDVHAFTNGNKVQLCGVGIPHDKSLAGHSDADAALHAITDALLGAIAAGDIGQHFPPSDPQWKGADSAVFLQHAAKMVRARGGEIVNIDVTIICEAPKIGPHREKMQKRVAAICGLAPGQIGIKATTAEGLGFTGRGEGIAAQAVASVIVGA